MIFKYLVFSYRSVFFEVFFLLTLIDEFIGDLFLYEASDSFTDYALAVLTIDCNKQTNK